jgi:hypothetical protein
MQVNNFIEYLDYSEKITMISEAEITPIIEAFPYCQTGQLMYTIQLNSNNSILFEEQLKKTASICPDRAKLFAHIYSESIKKETSLKKEIIINKESKEFSLVDEKFDPIKEKEELSVLEQEYLASAINSSIFIESDDAVVVPAEISEVNLFNESVSHSFVSWLKYYNGEEQDVIPIIKRERDQDIINKFIQEDPRIKPKDTEFYSPANMARLSETDSGIVTETLALIHVDQGNFKDAITTYEKLMVKNPKKSSYFASQIKILKQKLK